MSRQPMPMRLLIEQYLASQVRQGRMSRATARERRGELYRFADTYGERPVANVTANAVERWAEGFERYAPATRQTRWSMVNRFLNWLAAEGHITGNPMLQMAAPKVPRRQPRNLPHEHVGRLLEACPDVRARLIVLLMVQCGLRRVEVVRLELGDVDFADRTIRVRGKGDHERLLPVPAEAWAALTEYAQGIGATTGPLLRSYTQPHKGLSVSAIGHYVSAWMAEAGIKGRPGDGISGHALRHTMATDTLRAGAHLRDVQHALGHAHLATTERYLSNTVHGLAHAMEGRTYGGVAR